jgi:hypothetical protein
MPSKPNLDKKLVQQGLQDFREAMIAMKDFRGIVWKSCKDVFNHNLRRINHLTRLNLNLETMSDNFDEEYISCYVERDYTKNKIYGIDLGLYWWQPIDSGKSDVYAYASLYLYPKEAYAKMLDKIQSDGVEEPDNFDEGYYFTYSSRKLHPASSVSLNKELESVLGDWFKIEAKVQSALFARHTR